MKTFTAGKLKSRFSEVLKEIIAYLVSKSERIRKLGILQGKGKAIFTDDLKMTEEEFLGL